MFFFVGDLFFIMVNKKIDSIFKRKAVETSSESYNIEASTPKDVQVPIVTSKDQNSS